MITERKGLISGCPYYPSFTDHTHIPDKDVPDLGEFVQGMRTDEAATPRYVLLLVFQHMRGLVMGCAHLHGPELVQFKVLLIPTYSFLRE